MAKRSTPKPKADAPAQDSAPATDATATPTKIEEAAAANAAGIPTPPAMGNEGMAAAAGEGQPSLANATAPREPEDGVTLSETVTAGIAGGGADAAPLAEPTLIVTGPKAGRWRIGRKFGPEPVSIAFGDLKLEEMEALGSDPLLTVEMVATPY